MKYKVLWIEDGAMFEAKNLAGPVYNSRRYDLVIALSISDAIREIVSDEFDAVIVDIRMEPGDLSPWVVHFQHTGQNKATARLGLRLLESLLLPHQAPVKLESVPDWVEPTRFGVLTVEGWEEVSSQLQRLGITKRSFREKNTSLKPDGLLELIDAVIAECSNQNSRK